MREPKAIVREGYDAVSHNYREDTFNLEHTAYGRYLPEFAGYIQKGARILDLGCGCGVPVAQYLAGDYRVTGVDLSAVQIDRARALVPEAQFLCGDMTEIEFPPASFEAVISFFAIIHVPKEQQYALFQQIARWLAPGGHLLLTVGRREWTGTEPEWHGAEMYWSHFNRETYLEWLENLSFRILAEHFIPEGDGGHPVFIARKNQSKESLLENGHT